MSEIQILPPIVSAWKKPHEVASFTRLRVKEVLPPSMGHRFAGQVNRMLCHPPGFHFIYVVV